MVGPDYLVSRDGDRPHVEVMAASNPRDPKNLLAGAITFTRRDGGRGDEGLRELRRRRAVGRRRLPGTEGARRGRSPGRLHGGGHRDLRDPRDAGGRERAHPGVPARLPVRGRRADLVGALRSRGFLRPPDAGGGPDDGALRRTALHERALRPGVQPRRLPLGGRWPELDRPSQVPRRRRGAGAERGSAAGVARRGHHGSLPGLPVHAGTDGGLDRNAHLDGGLDGWRG